ncbi:endonuclease [Desulfobacter hydrogenophilus]|uniref:endonuclease n=1 Tax=Desulfobacter hydrogenophilus TaxID=2291 RepID=UPI002417EF3B|nr:endonuclease [Desulfobacter hydrogenophilus]
MAYRYIQRDMYNLVPAIGQVNALRSNYSYAMIPTAGNDKFTFHNLHHKTAENFY